MDDRNLVESMRLRLETAGYEVIPAFDEGEAAKLAGTYRSDFYALLRKHHLTPGAFKQPG
jgi:DNA-binding response OmpR family regulator